MHEFKILDIFNCDEIYDIAKTISKYFPHSPQEIYQVIFQVDSIDKALHCIWMANECGLSLDYAVYCVLKRKDDEKYEK